jgi:hypothetical protein
VTLCLTKVPLVVNKYAARRGLRDLERAGLVTVQRRPGRGLEVTLLQAPGEAPAP